MKSTFARPGFVLTLEREDTMQTSRGHYEPLKAWSHVDSHGHSHTFDDAGQLPSLHWVVTDTYWCDQCSDEHEEGEWRCRECEEAVEPTYRFTGEQTFMVPGLMTCKVELKNGSVYLLDESEVSSILSASEGEQEEVVLRTVKSKEPILWFPTSHQERTTGDPA